MIFSTPMTKNSWLSISLGSLLFLVVAIWTTLDIGRPLFAADLATLEHKIDAYQVNTAVQILMIRKESLQSDDRIARRTLRHEPGDDAAEDDLLQINNSLQRLNARISCYRSLTCNPEPNL